MAPEDNVAPLQPLPIVVDANIIISLLIAKGSKHTLFFSSHISPVSPDWALFEIGKHWDILSEKSGLSEEELKSEFEAVRLQLKTARIDELESWLNEARKISPDTEDAEYFALALKYDCPLWSHDSDLAVQSKVEVLSTKELLIKLGLAQDSDDTDAEEV